MEESETGDFESEWRLAKERVRIGSAGEVETRVRLWRAQEFHNWLRWRICRKGFDWSKPGVIVLNAVGFAALVWYGFQTGRFYVTAGGIVGWFTAVNLGFFTYFGLTLPGPPRTVPEILNERGTLIRAEMGLYPVGYERRKLARVWLRILDEQGAVVWFELALTELSVSLKKLLEAQTMTRMQRGDAPLTRAVVRVLGKSRAEIDAGRVPVEVVAWDWEEGSGKGFGRG